MINKENIRKWVDALRSGRFTQGIGCLKRFNENKHKYTHCCLGVACEVAEESGVSLSIVDQSYFVFDDETALLPFKVIKWLGVECGDPLIKAKPGDKLSDGETSCIDANDTLKYTFDEIADGIEKKYLK